MTKTTFRVPLSIAVFAGLGDNPDRDMEWGVPPPIERTSKAYFYDPQDAPNVLQCISEVASALQVDSDCRTEAGRVLYWVKRGRAELAAVERIATQLYK